MIISPDKGVFASASPQSIQKKQLNIEKKYRTGKMEHINTEYCQMPVNYMNETQESRERNGPEVYKNE